MAVTAFHLTTATDTTNASPWTTASITPTANRLVLAWVNVVGTATLASTPTLSGCGLTWVLVATTGTNAVHEGALYRAMGAAPTAGAVTITSIITAPTRCNWSISEFSGVDTSGADGAGAIVQSITGKPTAVTSVSQAFTAAIAAGDGTFGGVDINVGDAFTAGTGWTALGQATVATPVGAIIGMAGTSGVGVSPIAASWTNSGNAWIAGVEIKAAPVATPSSRLVNPRNAPVRLGRYTLLQGTAASGPQAYTSSLSGAVGFTGADATRTATGLAAATVGFTGAVAKRTARALTAAISFTGSLATAAVHAFTQALTATLSFTGAQAKRTAVGKSATVSFTGTQARGVSKGIAATVSFTGAQARRISQGATAIIAFTGAQTRRVGKGVAAAVSFTGSLGTAAVHFFTQALTATVGFTGSVTRRTSRTTAAAVGFTVGALTRRIGHSQTATVGFVGSLPRRIGTRLTAALGFLGGLLGQGSGTQAPSIELIIPARLGTLEIPVVERTLVIGATFRTLETPEAERTLAIPAATRTLEIPEV